jgi:glycosyltransferase involved in cell wall biosynthesis
MLLEGIACEEGGRIEPGPHLRAARPDARQSEGVMISVIIPVYNGEKDLPQLLESLLKTRLRDYELIVVDDGSTDSTVAQCERFPTVKVIRIPENRGPAYARNLGTSHARGDIFVFVDHDVAVPEDSDILWEMARVFEEKPHVDCVSSPSDVRPLGENAIAYNASVYHTYYMDRLFGGRSAVEGRIMFFTTRFGAVRRRAFQEVGGFHESLYTVMGEDGEFGSRSYHKGLISHFDRRFVHFHRFPTTFRKFVRSYFLSAMVQRFMDRKMDTRPNPTICFAEKFRRLLSVALLASPGLLLLDVRAAPWGLLLGVVAFLLAFGRMNRLIWKHVPLKHRVQWYLVYLAITPVILAGYAWGECRFSMGRSLLQGKPSSNAIFRVEAEAS